MPTPSEIPHVRQIASPAPRSQRNWAHRRFDTCPKENRQIIRRLSIASSRASHEGFQINKKKKTKMKTSNLQSLQPHDDWPSPSPLLATGTGLECATIGGYFRPSVGRSIGRSASALLVANSFPFRQPNSLLTRLSGHRSPSDLLLSITSTPMWEHVMPSLPPAVPQAQQLTSIDRDPNFPSPLFPV